MIYLSIYLSIFLSIFLSIIYVVLCLLSSSIMCHDRVGRHPCCQSADDHRQVSLLRSARQFTPELPLNPEAQNTHRGQAALTHMLPASAVMRRLRSFMRCLGPIYWWPHSS